MISVMGSPTQIKSLFWTSYFVASIAVLGVPFAFLGGSPFYLLGRVFRPARNLADRILLRGVQVLMAVQPWYSAKIEIPRLPGRVLVVSNHRSHLDVFLLLSRIPGLRIVAKQSLFGIPFLGFMMRMMEQIPVTSGSLDGFYGAMEIVRAKLRAGETVHVFPELTRCEPGYDGVRNFSLLPFQIAIQEKARVLPVMVKGTDSVWGKGELGIHFRRSIAVKALDLIDAQEFKTAQDLKTAVQSRIERALQ